MELTSRGAYDPAELHLYFQIGNNATWWQIVRELEAAEPMQAVGDGIIVVAASEEEECTQDVLSIVRVISE